MTVKEYENLGVTDFIPRHTKNSYYQYLEKFNQREHDFIKSNNHICKTLRGKNLIENYRTSGIFAAYQRFKSQGQFPCMDQTRSDKNNQSSDDDSQSDEGESKDSNLSDEDKNLISMSS